MLHESACCARMHGACLVHLTNLFQIQGVPRPELGITKETETERGRDGERERERERERWTVAQADRKKTAKETTEHTAVATTTITRRTHFAQATRQRS